MKKIKMVLLYSMIIAFAWTQTGCFGSFSLTRKVWEFNKEVGDKIVQEAVFLVMVIIPVYEVCSFVDAVILNLVEFWTGSNPLAMKPGEVDIHKMALKGSNYRVTAMQNKFIVEKQNGSSYVMVGTLEYKSRAWYSNSENREHKLVGYNASGQVEVYSKDNKVYKMDKNLASADMLKKMIQEDNLASR